jgi:2-polyprenyl-3-methyl-5-hydroxy-6-metoxy-1,4-benzoquinol methylase
MNDTPFQSYSKFHVHFYGRDIPRLLESALAAVNKSVDKFSMLDIGCGDGRLIFALYEEGLLKNAERIVGVDISEDRIQRLKSNLPFVEGIVANALNVKELPDSSFDFIVCAQLLEHVENEKALISEIGRLLRRHGLAYISSVIKKRWGIYVYFKNGSFKLDPTHLREYSSKREFLDAMIHQELEIVKVETNPVRFPAIDLITRLWIRGGLAEPEAEFYRKHKNLGRFRRLKLAIIGYETVEALFRRLA